MTSAYDMSDDERREFAEKTLTEQLANNERAKDNEDSWPKIRPVKKKIQPPKFGAESEGCWVDNCLGIYMGERIIDIAIDHGWVPLENNGTPYVGDQTVAGEHYDELISEAEEFMNGLAAEGFYFGYSDGFGDWGLWAIEEEELS